MDKRVLGIISGVKESLSTFMDLPTRVRGLEERYGTLDERVTQGLASVNEKIDNFKNDVKLGCVSLLALGTLACCYALLGVGLVYFSGRPEASIPIHSPTPTPFFEPTPTHTLVIPTETPTPTPTTFVELVTPAVERIPTPTPLETPEPVNLEYDIIVSGWLVRQKPEYDPLWNFINRRTGVDRQNIARVVIYDSKNQMQVDWIKPDGSVAFNQPYILKLSEQGVDDIIWNLTKQYHKEIVYIPDSRLEAILKSQDKGLEGFADLLMEAQPGLTRKQLLQLLKDNYAITLNPNIYSRVNTDNPMVSIVLSEDVSEPPQQIRVNEELYEYILDYVGVPTQRDDPR